MKFQILRLALLLSWFAPGPAVSDDAPAASSKECKPWGTLHTVRGFCPDEYLRLDIIDERGHDAVRVANERYFSVNVDRLDPYVGSLDAQIRHGEEGSRSRPWRGEFRIHIRQDRDGAIAADLVRAGWPLWPQAHRLLHETYADAIAAAFLRRSSDAPDEYWAAQVRRILPSIEEVVHDFKIERLSTDSLACPQLAERMKSIGSLRQEPMGEESGTGKPGTELVPIYMHPEWYTVVVRNSTRTFSIRDVNSEHAFFKWADGTVQALQTCWKPAPATPAEE